jgi:hypothetical protein
MSVAPCAGPQLSVRAKTQGLNCPFARVVGGKGLNCSFAPGGYGWRTPVRARTAR